MEIAPGIYSVDETKGAWVRAFLLDDGNGLTLVDSLVSSNAAIILAELARIGKQPGDIKRIVLSHAHRAHLGGLSQLKSLSGAAVHSHAWEADIIAGERPIQSTTLRPLRPLRVWPFQISARFGHHAPCPVDRCVQEGDRVGPLHVLHAPGHTPGHLAFYWPERRALFAGDSIVTYPELGPGWPAFMLNPKENLRTMQRMAGMDIELLGVGHGAPIPTGGRDRLRALLKQIKI